MLGTVLLIILILILILVLYLIVDFHGLYCCSRVCQLYVTRHILLWT